MKQKSPSIEQKLSAYNDSFYQIIATIQSPEQAKCFFEDLCSPAETQAMIDRWGAATLIQQGKTQRDIAHELNISVTTVSRVARCINTPNSGYQQLLNQDR